LSNKRRRRHKRQRNETKGELNTHQPSTFLLLSSFPRSTNPNVTKQSSATSLTSSPTFLSSLNLFLSLSAQSTQPSHAPFPAILLALIPSKGVTVGTASSRTGNDEDSASPQNQQKVAGERKEEGATPS